MKRAILGLVSLAVSGCTYSSSVTRIDDLPAEERVLRVVDVLEEVAVGPPAVDVAPGPVPDTLVLSLSAPLEARCRVVLARRARRELREAEATYVPRRSLLKHGLAFSLGVAVFAPVWLPLHYHGLAVDAAAAALERGDGGSRYDAAGGCYVTRVERADLAADWVDAGEVVERDLQRVGPPRGERVGVRAARGQSAATWTGRTDARGRVVVPLRALVPGRGSPPGELEVTTRAGSVVVVVPSGAWAPGDPDGSPIDGDALAARDLLESVVRRLARNVGTGALAPDSAVARALPGLLRRRGAPLALTDAARPHVEAAARALRAAATGHEAPALDLAEARRHALAAVAAQPGSWEAHRLLGLAARLAGDEATATARLRVAWCLLPEASPSSDRVLAELVAP